MMQLKAQQQIYQDVSIKQVLVKYLLVGLGEEQPLLFWTRHIAPGIVSLCVRVKTHPFGNTQKEGILDH